MMSRYFQVAAAPHPWPGERQGGAQKCALLIVDMQDDYCSPGFYIERAGYDLTGLRAPIGPIQKVLKVARGVGMEIIFTRHASHTSAAEQAELGATVHRRPPSYPSTAARGEPGWHIIQELRPRPGELIVDKNTISAFLSTELHATLRRKGIQRLAICGNTIDVCVHSTLRTAVDLGYECLVLADCCGAVEPGLHAWSVASVQIENGVFGTVADSAAFETALR